MSNNPYQDPSEGFSQDPFNSRQNPYSSSGDPHAVQHTFVPAAPNAAEMVRGPAIGIIVVAVIGMVLAGIGMALNVFAIVMTTGMDTRETTTPADQFALLGQGAFGILQSVVGFLIGALCIVGAVKMQRLESYGIAMAASVLILVPCLSPCCLAGLPVGIWGLMVLNNPAVKAAFRS